MQNSRTQAGFLSLPNDSMFKTLAVALTLCLVCSIIVSTAATLLKPRQVVNKLLDKKKNILAVSGIELNGKSVDELFTQIETRVVDMRSGDYTDAVDANTFDQRKASKDSTYRVELDRDQDIAKLGGGRSKYASVYLVNNGDQLERIILPIKGYGLWSTMYGFLALEKDATTVSGITFYEHGETPGLGGEIENPKWQASWQGKQIIDQGGQPALRVIKGGVNPNSADAVHQIDGLAGATLTSNGVSNLIMFWVGDNGFGPYLEKLRLQSGQLQQASSNRDDSVKKISSSVIIRTKNQTGQG
ncbi:MAG: Na+-transporting NADH:ubiquinone oxidoreductase subunit C [Dinoroseobacter sp.]|jgi:Na+-transporting NADH:ubiquinone oxidoreductase subunit C